MHDSTSSEESESGCYKKYKFVLFVFWRHRNGVQAHLHSVLTTAPDGEEFLTSRTGRFNPGKENRYLLQGEVCGSHDRSAQFWDAKTSPTGICTPARPGRSTVSIPTELRVHLSHHNIMGSRLHFILFTKDTNFFQYFPAKNMREQYEFSFKRIWYFFGPLFVADLWMLQLFSMIDKLFLSVNRRYWKSFLWSSYSVIAYKVHNHANITPFSFMPSFDPLEMNTSHCAVHWASEIRN